MLCGGLFLVAIFVWILIAVPGYTFLHHFILALYLGSYFGFFGLAFVVISRRLGVGFALFAAPFIWVSLEFIRSNLFFLALPWVLLAHSQYKNPLVIQIASVTGAYGISFLVVAVNSAFTAMVLPLVDRLRKTGPLPDRLFSKHGRIAVVCTAILLVSVTLFYGYIKISEPIVGQRINLSVIQGDIEQAKKWDRRYAKFIMKTYAELTQQASEEQPVLIVWPETATPGDINREIGLYSQVRNIAKEAGTHLLLGSAHRQKFKKENSGKKLKYLNSALLVPPEGDRTKNQRYDKIRLLPFSEYLPLKGTIPWNYIEIPNFDGYVPGNEYTVFEIPPFRFSVTICWENIFPDLVRRFVKGGAQFIVNITNEARFGKTSAPYQFVSMNVFRAVENRVYVVRCANTGVSCFIDPYGQIVDRVRGSNNQDIFVRGVLSGSVIPLESKTFYTLYGDWLAWLSLVSSAACVIVALFKKPVSKF
jgi:apolipoprotein N-acyltransferase